MKFGWIISFLFMLNTVPGIGQLGKSCQGKYPEDLSATSDSKLSKAFLKLKKGKNADCNRFNSDLHRIMNALGERLGKNGTHVNKVFELMGHPDSYIDELGVASVKESQTIWIYHWRGWHDWLYFIVQDNLVVKADWWLAYE